MITAQETIIRVSWLINLHVDMYKYKDMNKYIPMAGVASMLQVYHSLRFHMEECQYMKWNMYKYIFTALYGLKSTVTYDV